MEPHPRKNPWLGLESYQEGEILYGRDEDIRDLIQCVLNDIDTLLYGKSGIGKSSLLNAGILPAARRNGYVPVLIRLSHKKGDNYLTQIREAIINAMELSGKDKDEILKRIKEITACKDEHRESLYEFFHRHTFHDTEGNRIKLLIIFDQFEEIFTLQTNEVAKRAFFAQMADMLNDIMPTEIQQFSALHSGPKELVSADDTNADDLFDDIDFDIKDDLPEYVNDNVIHFVFTIREDFLSEFEYHTSPIPSLKQNRYGLRPINEEQASQIILRPEPGMISLPVAKLIIEKVTGRTDFELDGIPEIDVDSAVLSLYLNRLYEAKTSDSITSDLVEQKGGQIITDFYNEAISAVSPSTVEYLEDNLINGQGRRDNITVYDAIHEGGVTEEELDILCNKNKILRQFNYAGVLRIEYIHDILCPIISERKESREEEKRIKKLERAAREEKIKSKKRLVMALAAFFTLAIGVSAYFIYDWYFNSYVLKTRHIAYELRNGWPVGVGPELTEEQCSHLPVYYELSHPGHDKRQFTTVKVCSSNTMIDQNAVIIPLLLTGIIPTDSVPSILTELQTKIKTVIFSATADTNDEKEHPTLDNMAFYDKDNNLLFTVKYSQDARNGAWYKFFTDNGQPMTINDNYIDRINVITDSAGYTNSVVYYDSNGVKRPLWDGVYGFVQTEIISDSSFYNIVGEVSVTTVNQFNQPTNDVANTVQTKYGRDNVTLSYFHKDNDSGKLERVNNTNGYSTAVLSYNQYDYYMAGAAEPVASMKIERDRRGNITKTTLNDPNRILRHMPTQTILTYDGAGHVTGKEMLNRQGKPFSPDHAVYKYTYGYSDNGELLMHEEVADTGLVYLYKKEHLAGNVISVTHGGISKNSREVIPFHIRTDSVLPDNTIVSYYYDLEHRPINYLGTDDQSYHKVVSSKNDSIEKYAYYKMTEGKIMPLNDKDSYFRLERTLDNNGNELFYRTFSESGEIIKSMRYYYDNGRLVGRAVMGIDNTPVRCDQWDEDGFLYYKLFFNRDFTGEYSDIMAVNEFSQPTLIYNDDFGYFNIKYGDFIDASLDCSDIQLKPSLNIGISKHYWQYYPVEPDNKTSSRMTYLHILDKDNILYASGLRDGDVVYAWPNSGSNAGNEDSLKERLAGCRKITVLRIENGEYKKRTVNFPRALSHNDLQSVHFHTMNLSTSEHLPSNL